MTKASRDTLGRRKGEKKEEGEKETGREEREREREKEEVFPVTSDRPETHQ